MLAIGQGFCRRVKDETLVESKTNAGTEDLLLALHYVHGNAKLLKQCI